MKRSKFSINSFVTILIVIFAASSLVISSTVMANVPTWEPMSVKPVQGVEKEMSPQTDSRQQTEKLNLVAKELGISLAGNVLVFKTIEDYRRAVDNPTEEVSGTVTAVVMNYFKFQSYLNSKARAVKSEFNDEYFESLLNSDKVIQIDENLFRVNPNTGKVFVLPAAKINEYKDLIAENISNRSISVYSTDEDVLDLIKGKASNQKALDLFGLFCNEGGVGGDAAQIDFYYGGEKINTLAAFNKYGIYFSLFASVNPSLGSSQFLFEFNGIGGYIHWHARCGLTVDYPITSSGNNNPSNKQRYQSYQGSRNLANFWFGYRILLKSNGTPLTQRNMIHKNW